jgi:hypothetical protein
MSAATLNPIKGSQQAIVKDLEADGFFSNVPVIDQNKGDVLAEVDAAIKGLGLAVTVEITEGELNSEGLGDAQQDVIITVEENVLINRAEGGTGKECTDVVVAIVLRFHPFLRGAAGPSPVLLTKYKPVNDVGNKLVYQLLGKSKIRFVKQ